jgi:hypothetical protein
VVTTSVLEGTAHLLGGDKTTRVGNIRHEVCAFFVRNLPQLGIVPVARVGRGTDDQLWFEELGLGSKVIIGNEVSVESEVMP